jgi:hypothetical protein
LTVPDEGHGTWGLHHVAVEGEDCETRFVKVAVNVIRKPGSDRNELPGLMRKWFGPGAGLPGTNFSVVFERRERTALGDRAAPRGP